ncbi:la-related protein 6A-like [Zingiber officinale]|uniref:la-related protein 6A-like n=1 Tax=Zingiber officinale TaxID=94328 RepID=UPI001C4B62A6|nr:la-related protein 6A-like [Zingiber officinale]
MEENQLEGLGSLSLLPPPLPSLDVGVALSDPSGDAAARREAQGSEADPTRVAAPGRDSGEEGIVSDVTTAFHVEVDIFDAARGDVSLREAEVALSGPVVLSGELRDEIVRQVEYYFSDENLSTDSFLLTFIKKDKEGYVPIKVISSFRRMKKLTQELSLIGAALTTSSQLVVSEDGRKVKRLQPSSVEIADTKLRTVIVENLPDDCSEANIRRIFGKLGKIVKVTVHNPHLMEKLTSQSKSRIILSSKIHSFVEYGTVEAAESAVNSLNDEKNWRSGMRVELLAKRMEKHWLSSKGRKVTISENNSSLVEEPTADGEKISIDCHNEVAMKEEGGRGKGIRRTKYKSRGRGQAQQNGNCHGGSASGVELVNKHVQGPRMPDGTRGFAFGRGKPTS